MSARKLRPPRRELVAIIAGGAGVGVVFNLAFGAGVMSPGGLLGGVLSGLLLCWLS